MSGAAWGNGSVRRARVRGCLLGGAIGDALGNPVEFLSLAGIRRAHGEQGVRGLTADEDGVTGRVTDDTQMTLFTAEGLIRAHSRAMAKGIGGAETAVIRHAYLRWLDTQNHPAPPPAAATTWSVPAGSGSSPGCTRGGPPATRA